MRSMVFLLMFVLGGLWLLCSFNEQSGLRETFLKAFLLFFGLLAVGTEILSFFNQINIGGLIVLWIGSLLVISLLIWRKLASTGKSPFEAAVFRPIFRESSSALLFTLLGLCIVFLMLTLITALQAPPNNFDAMTYHMARVAHWIQNQNIQYYPTFIPRQNYSMPLAEYAVLHLQLLSRSDQYANLVQWSSYLMSIVAASLIMGEYVPSKILQAFTGLLVAATPMAILQSSNAQNDLVVAAFCLAFFYFLMKLPDQKRPWGLVFTGLSFGLALMTKGTAYLYSCAIGLLLGGAYLLQKVTGEERKKRLVNLMIIVLLGLTINAGVYIRNWQLYGHPLSTGVERILNGYFSLGVLGVNWVRNYSMHLGIPFPEINALMSARVEALLGQAVNLPAATFGEEQYLIPFLIHEDVAGNLPQLLGITAAFIGLPFLKKERRQHGIILGAVVLLAALLYNGFIRWQPWASRLHLPLFFLGVILIVFVFKHLLSRHSWMLWTAAGLLLIYSIPFLLLNSSRPLLANRSQLAKRAYKVISDAEIYKFNNIFQVDREQQYFVNFFDLYQDYQPAADFVRKSGAQEIGLYLDSNSWEYPFWVLLDQHAGENSYTITHFGVENNTRRLSTGVQSASPEMVIALSHSLKEEIAGERYYLEERFGIIGIWSRTP